MRGTIVTTASLRGLCRRLAQASVSTLGLGLAVSTVAPGVGPFLVSTAQAQVPGVESFKPEPRTPIELWHAVDYLVRTDQAKSALPYLEKFVASKPDDSTLMAIRDRYGAGSFLRLDDFPETRKYAEPLVRQLSEATRRQLTHPKRVAQFISELTRSPEERTYAVSRLREAGAFAIPSLVDALSKPGLSSSDHALLVQGMGRLDAKAVPALIAVLDSPDSAIAIDAASALGAIGDKRALPFLVIKATDKKQSVPPSVRTAARRAIEEMTGAAIEALPQSPVQLLTDAAWSFHRHKVEFPGQTVAVWEWDTETKRPAPRARTKAQAESGFARKFGRAAVDLDPEDLKARVALVSAELEQAVGRTGFDDFKTKEADAFADTVAAGPKVLTGVMRDSITDGKSELTAVAVEALGQASRDVPFAGSAGYVHPLV